MEPSLLKAALDRGINFIDTGRSYYNGQNEVMVGKVIKGIREKVIIQSKVRVRIRERRRRRCRDRRTCAQYTLHSQA